MRRIELGYGAIAFEPDSPGDSVYALDAQKLRAQGLPERAITTYEKMRDRDCIKTPDGYVRRSFLAALRY